MQKIFIITSLMMLTVLSIYSQTCEIAENIGGGNNDLSKSIAVDKNGFIFIAGYYASDTILFNNGISLVNSGGEDGYIARYNNKGICLWAENIGGINDDDRINSTSVDKNGNVYIAGYFTSDTLNFNNGKKLITEYSGINYKGFIAKYNENGICQWAEITEGNGSNNIKSIEVDILGNTYLTGSYSTFINFKNGISLNSNNSGGYIAKYNTLGLCQWAENNGAGDKIAIDNNGFIYVTGTFSSDILYFNNNKFITHIGGFEDIFFAKYNNDGICQWAEKIGGSSEDLSSGIGVDDYGNVYLAGAFRSDTLFFNNDKNILNSGISDGFLAKFNNNGNCEWVEAVKGIGSELIGSIKVTGKGNIFLSGVSDSDIATFNNEIILTKSGINFNFISKYKNNGLCLWSDKIYGSKTNFIRDITVDESSNFYITGHYNPDITFNNNKKLENDDNFNIFFAKYKDNPTSVLLEENQNIFSVYPNPANNIIQIKTSEDFVFSDGYNVQIYNMLGILVEHSFLSDSNNQIDVSHLISGIYYIKIGDKIRKFVKI